MNCWLAPDVTEPLANLPVRLNAAMGITEILLLYTIQFALVSSEVGNSTTTPGSLPVIQPPVIQYERDLVEHLMDGYRKNARPKKEYFSPIIIYMTPRLLKIHQLDEQNEVLHANMYLHLAWIDDFLTWNTAQTAGMFETMLPASDVWTPRINLYSSMKEDNEPVMPIEDHMVTIYSNGLVVTSPMFYMKTSCPVNLQVFPFDVQACQLVFIPLHTNNYLSFQIPPEEATTPETYEENNEWSNVNTTLVAGLYVQEIEGVNRSMDVIIVMVYMERNPTFYVIYILVPSILMAFVSVLVFLLPPESGERIGLIITVLLSYTVFLLMVSEFTPRGGKHTPMLSYYITGIEVLSGLNIFLTVIILRIHNQEADVPLPECFKCLVRKKQQPLDANPWHLVAKKLDMMLFGISLVFVIILSGGLMLFYYIQRQNLIKGTKAFYDNPPTYV